MKKRLFVSTAAALMCLTMAVSCGGTPAGGGTGSKQTISLWVGTESVDFYTRVANEFATAHPELNFDVKVTGVDTGTVGGTMTTDNTSCGDIITVAHDNIGKLVAKNVVKPVVEQSLIDQVLADNPDSYKNVIYSNWNDQRYLFGVPYISQALMLYYNTDYVTPEEAKTFEGLKEAAKKVPGGKAKAFTITGTDGFNFSFPVLARKADDNSTTVKIYENGEKNNCYVQGDDQVAIAKWGQKMFADPNGGLWPTDAKWAVDIKNGAAVSVIGGAWHYNAFAGAVGESKMGVTVLPTFTLTEDEAIGDYVAGTKFQAGTFADCKVFMINANSSAEKYAPIQALLKHLASKEVQNASFKECLNVPAYKGSEKYIESIKNDLKPSQYQLAYAQTKMNNYGIPQPFLDPVLNSYYYSKSAPDLYKNILINDQNTYGTERKIREGLYTIEHIWQKGQTPKEIPQELPKDI